MLKPAGCCYARGSGGGQPASARVVPHAPTTQSGLTLPFTGRETKLVEGGAANSAPAASPDLVVDRLTMRSSEDPGPAAALKVSLSNHEGRGTISPSPPDRTSPSSLPLGRRAGRGTGRGTRRGGRAVVPHIVLAAFIVYFALPFWWLIVASTKSQQSLFDGKTSPLWFSGQFDLFSNIGSLFSYSGGLYAHWLGNSFLYALAGGIGATVLSVLAGYGFSMYGFRGRRLFFAIVLGSVLIGWHYLVDGIISIAGTTAIWWFAKWFVDRTYIAPHESRATLPR